MHHQHTKIFYIVKISDSFKAPYKNISWELIFTERQVREQVKEGNGPISFSFLIKISLKKDQS